MSKLTSLADGPTNLLVVSTLPHELVPLPILDPFAVVLHIRSRYLRGTIDHDRSYAKMKYSRVSASSTSIR